jgi:hypothetical protein
MAFPTSPTNGQLATLNGITYQYSSATTSWARVPQSIRITYTAGATPPQNPLQGDQWYNSTTDVLYEYTNDSVSSYWLDIQTPAFVGNNLSLVTGANTFTSITVNNTTLVANNQLSTFNLSSSNGITLSANIASNTINFDGNIIFSQVNTVFNQANSSYAQLNVAFNQTNTVFNYANSAYNQANTAYTLAFSTLGVPQNAQTGAYTLQLSDQGKHIYSTTSSNVAIILPNNGTVSWNIGTSILIVLNAAAPTTINLQPATGVTMYLAGNTTSPIRAYANIASYGVASLLNVAANTWFINGAGVS